MKKNKFVNNFLIWIALVVLIIISRLPAATPWWSFVIPVFIFGGFLSWYKNGVPGFKTGFLAGFAVWCGFNLYNDINNGGLVFDKLASILSTAKPVVLAASGIIGGILTGLAFYAGKIVFADKITNATL